MQAWVPITFSQKEDSKSRLFWEDEYVVNNFLCVPGGPLCEGDIEEADGVLQVFCPWHDYDFDLRTGKSGTSLQVSGEICHSCFIKLRYSFIKACVLSKYII